MARDELTLVGRGEVFPFYDSAGNVDATAGAYLEGTERQFEDIDYSVYGTKTYRSGKMVTCRLVRNSSGGAVLPKLFYPYKTNGSTADVYGGQVAAAATTLGLLGGVADEFLPAAGAAASALFWLVVEGPTLVKTSTSGSDDTNIPAAAAVVPAGNAAGYVMQRSAIDSAGTSEAQYEAAMETVITSIEGTIGRTCLAVNATATDVMIIARRML